MIEVSEFSHCTVPYFGFKAKPGEDMMKHHLIVLCLILDSRQNFWSPSWQDTLTPSHMYCTVPYFGFKAKLARICSCCMVDCTVPYFGFKAKQKQLY